MPLDTRDSLGNLFDVALRAEQAGVQEEQALIAQLVVFGTAFHLAVSFHPRLGADPFVRLRTEGLLQKRLLVETATAGAARNAFPVQGLQKFAPGHAGELERVVAGAGSVAAPMPVAAEAMKLRLDKGSVLKLFPLPG